LQYTYFKYKQFNQNIKSGLQWLGFFQVAGNKLNLVGNLGDRTKYLVLYKIIGTKLKKKNREATLMRVSKYIGIAQIIDLPLVLFLYRVIKCPVFLLAIPTDQYLRCCIYYHYFLYKMFKILSLILQYNIGPTVF